MKTSIKKVYIKNRSADFFTWFEEIRFEPGLRTRLNEGRSLLIKTTLREKIPLVPLAEKDTYTAAI